MTLIEVIHKLKDVAMSKHNVNFVGDGDIYELNSTPNIDYGVFFITQGTHSADIDTTSYTLNLFYVDRLTDNKDNALLIQSNGIGALTNIINEFTMTEDVDVEYPLQFQPFTQRFSDECAGVYCTVTLITDSNLGLCYE